MIQLQSVRKQYPNGTVAVHELTLDVPDGGIAVLVGPSGCGKTTILRMINRLTEPTSGRILFDGDDVTHADPVQLRRRIGYVIQQIGLFPHQTIAHNVATVPRLLGWPHARIDARVDELLALVGLDPESYGDRYPNQLSGGQQQRVGVARALAADPPVLLMDEPFGAIDPVTRTRLQDEFLRLQSELRKTVVFVTHDIDEAVKMGDRIAILNVGGVLEQFDTPAQILGAPATDFVASFVGGDRALKRLKVTPIDPHALDAVATLSPDDALAEARAVFERTGASALPVVDGKSSLCGRLRAEDADHDGQVVDHFSRVEAWVDIHDSLEVALARSLLSDDGWIAVLDGDRFLGTLTPDAIHKVLRNSLHEPAPSKVAQH
ncbi:MAG TPA: betaine/proline/choline family ABC transporter ATP-binding protein [Acidimicrobiia bacterium]|nr:betaine/proline/choline family ABC transporter ATP-binding protein [Acidimicrobiia bacterium]